MYKNWFNRIKSKIETGSNYFLLTILVALSTLVTLTMYMPYLFRKRNLFVIYSLMFITSACFLGSTLKRYFVDKNLMIKIENKFTFIFSSFLLVSMQVILSPILFNRVFGFINRRIFLELIFYGVILAGCAVVVLLSKKINYGFKLQTLFFVLVLSVALITFFNSTLVISNISFVSLLMIYLIVNQWKEETIKNRVLLVGTSLYAFYTTFIFLYRIIVDISSFGYVLHSGLFGLIFVYTVVIYYSILKAKLSSKILMENMIIFSTMLSLAILIESVYRGSMRFPILLLNIHIVNCILILCSVLYVLYFRSVYKQKSFMIMCFINIIILNALIWLSGTRLLLFLGLGMILFLVLFTFKIPWVRKGLFISLLIGATSILALNIANIGDSRENTQRQLFNLGIRNISGEYQDLARFNVDGGDEMRAYLREAGIREIRSNPVFGTGRLIYEYTLNDITYNQSAHNFLLESLAAHGIIGTGLVLGILLQILLSIFKEIPKSQYIYLLSSIFLLTAYLITQPIFFTPITLLIFIMIIYLVKETGNEDEMSDAKI